MCRLALGVECCVVRSGTQQFDMPSERGSWYMLRGAFCFLSEATSDCAAFVTPPRITCFTVVGHHPLLVSDKCKSIAPFVNSLVLDA